MRRMAELKPVFRSLQSRTAKASDVIRAGVCRVLPVLRSRVFAVIVYLCVTASLLAVSAAYTGVVRVTDRGNVRYLFTLRRDAQSILSQCGVKIYSADRYDFSGFQGNYATIKILRAFDVSVSADGRTQVVHIARGTVNDALKLADVSLGSDDLISKPVNTKLSDGMQVRVQRVTYQTFVQNKVIPCPIDNETTTLLERGDTQLMESGKNGVFSVTMKFKYIDGKVADQQILNQQVTRQPVSGRRLVGTALSTPVSHIEPAGFVLSSQGTPQHYSKMMEGLATAYSAKNGSGTSTGLGAGVGRVAVDPGIIPYGSRLYIVGSDGSFVYGYAVAADTGGFTAKKKVLVDLFFNTQSECSSFGVQNVKIYVLS